MHTTSLRDVDGAVMLAVSSDVLESLDLEAGSVGGMRVDGDRLVIESRKMPYYTLEDLLQQCDFSLPVSQEEQESADLRPFGKEVI